jgi:RNase P/RNase MRP subunit p29
MKEIRLMISEEQLDQYRQAGTLIRVVRDAEPKNDVKGIVVAWDDDTVMIRKQNRRIVKLDRRHHYQPFAEARNTAWIEGSL